MSAYLRDLAIGLALALGGNVVALLVTRWM